MLRSLIILLLFYGVGEWIASLEVLPLPGSVIGMLLLTIALAVGVLKPRHVRPTARLLLRHIILFFIPVSVGVMTAYVLIEEQWVAIVVAALLSTLLTLWVVGRIAQGLERRNTTNPKR